MSQPISIHPKNPKIFEFRGKPLVLICATEHYGAVMNRPFDFEAYLADAAEKKHTLTRLFTLFRELQTHNNPYSTCKPESTDYIAPFRRVGPQRALDGQPKFDLDQWNDEFFGRLGRFLSVAGDYGIIVEVTFLSNTYSDTVWALNPLNPANNVNMDPDTSIRCPEYMSCRHEAIFRRQVAHVEKIVQETNRHDNVIYEICNEPYGFREDDLPSKEEVNAWQGELIETVRQVEAPTGRRHLISGEEALERKPFAQPVDRAFGEMDFDIVNIHPLGNATYKGKGYDMGGFMTKDLTLQAVRDFALATYHEPKPLNYDEDNTATQYREPEGWTVHRKRAWTSVFSGTHYDMIDFSIRAYLPAGTPESRKGLRIWFKHLSEFVHSVDLASARPLAGWVRESPPHVLASVLGVEGSDYCVYLADEREIGEEGLGEAISGTLGVNTPTGRYEVSCFHPEEGRSVALCDIDGGEDVRIELPPFEHDIVIRIRHK